MTSRMRGRTRIPGLALAALLSIAGIERTPAAAAPAAPMPTSVQPPNAPTEQLEQLDQIVVRGENLMRAIADAEDSFYDLFNKLNKDDKYDTHCVYLQLDPNSQIRSRTCIPGFVADAMADQAYFAAECLPDFSNYDTNRDGRISMQEAQASQDLFAVFFTLDDNHDSSLSPGEYLHWAEWTTANCYHPPPPQLVLMEGSKDWAVHMMKMVNSDPRLKDMAGHLDDLYRELRSVQQKYVKAVEQDQPPKTARRELGPRIH